MQVDFRDNIRDVSRGLSDFAREQVPFATSLAINAVAEDVKAAAESDMRRRLDRPTAFTLRAYALRRSSKRTLEASVFAKDAQAAYLRFQESGGDRKPKGVAIVIPVGLKLNRFGNMPKGAIRKALARGDVFSGVPHKGWPGGIYMRTRAGGGQGLRMLAAFTPSASYKPGLKFKDGSERVALEKMPQRFQEAMARAIASARRR